MDKNYGLHIKILNDIIHHIYFMLKRKRLKEKKWKLMN